MKLQAPQEPPTELSSRQVRRQVRRKVLLEALSLAIPIGSAVLFSGLFIRGWSGLMSLVVAVSAFAMLVVAHGWHRTRVAACIDRPREDIDGHEQDRSDESEGGWDAFTLLLLSVSLVVVVVGGLVAAFLIPLVVIAMFAVTAASPGVVDVLAAAATGLTLATAAALEFGVVKPLCARWELEFDK